MTRVLHLEFTKCRDCPYSAPWGPVFVCKKIATIQSVLTDANLSTKPPSWCPLPELEPK